MAIFITFPRSVIYQNFSSFFLNYDNLSFRDLPSIINLSRIEIILILVIFLPSLNAIIIITLFLEILITLPIHYNYSCGKFFTREESSSNTIFDNSPSFVLRIFIKIRIIIKTSSIREKLKKIIEIAVVQILSKDHRS